MSEGLHDCEHCAELNETLADLKAEHEKLESLNKLYIERLQLEEKNHNTLKQLVGELEEIYDSTHKYYIVQRNRMDKLKQAIK